MNKILLTTIGLAAITVTSNAQIRPSQNDDGRLRTTIDCFDLDVTKISPSGTNISNGGTITIGGNLSGGTYLPDVSGYSITSFVTNYNSSGTTTASLSGGVLSFTGSVGLVTTSSQLKEANGLDKDCRTLDFSFNQCTVVDEKSDLFNKIRESEDSGNRIYYGVVGDERQSVLFSDAFKYNERTGTYEYDSTDALTTDGNDGKVNIAMYYLDARGNAVEFELEDQVTTVFKDFKVCVECTEVIPEPSSTALLGLGALSLLIRRKR